MLIGGIDDGVDRERRDVGDADLKSRSADFGNEQCGNVRHQYQIYHAHSACASAGRSTVLLHADVVEMLVQETARGALAADVQHVEEIVVGRELAEGVEMGAEAVEHDAVHVDAAILPGPGAARQLALVDQAGDEIDGAVFARSARS